MIGNLFKVCFSISWLFYLISCTQQSDPLLEKVKVEQQTLFVDASLIPCISSIPQQCMQVKRDRDGEYQPFYDKILGFNFKKGFEYQLLAERTITPNALGHRQPTVSWRLIKIISKKPVAIITDETDNELDENEMSSTGITAK